MSMISIHCNFPRDLIEFLEKDAEEKERNINSTIRYAVRVYMKKCKNCPIRDI